MSSFKPNPGLFRKLSEPCTKEVAQERSEAFAKELAALREKYVIPNLVCIVGMNYIDEDPDGDGENRSMAILQHGDAFQSAVLTAMASGSLQASITEELAGAASRGRKAASRN